MLRLARVRGIGCAEESFRKGVKPGQQIGWTGKGSVTGTEGDEKKILKSQLEKEPQVR